MATFGGPRIDGYIGAGKQDNALGVKTGYSATNDPYKAGYTAAKQAFASGSNTQTAANAAMRATLTDPNYVAPLVALPSGMTSPLGTANSLSDAQIIAQREQNLRNFQNNAAGGGAPITGGTPETGGTPSTPQTPAGPEAAGAGSAGAAQALAGYTEDEIAAALAGLEAQYGMTRAQLLADQTQAGAQYRLLLAQLERGRVQGIETATNDAVRRGIYRSGILGENIAEVEAATLEGRGQAEAQLQARTDATRAQLDNLGAMQAAQAAQIEAQLRSQYARTLLEAGIAPGAAMSGGAGAASAAAAPQVNTQGVGAVAPNLVPTTVQQTQQPQQVAPPQVVPTAPITTNPAPAYVDPRIAEESYRRYVEMLNSGMAPVQNPSFGATYIPGGGYRTL